MIYVKTQDKFLTRDRVRELINYVFEKAADIDIKDHHITVEVRKRRDGETTNGYYKNIDDRNHEIMIMRSPEQSDAEIALVLLHEAVHLYQHVVGDLKKLEYGFFSWQGTIFHNLMKHDLGNSWKSCWMPQEVDANEKSLMILKKLGRGFAGYRETVYSNSRIYTDPYKFMFGRWKGIWHKFMNSWWWPGLVSMPWLFDFAVGDVDWYSIGFVLVLPLLYFIYESRKQTQPPDIMGYAVTRDAYEAYVEYFRGFEEAAKDGPEKADAYEEIAIPMLQAKLLCLEFAENEKK